MDGTAIELVVSNALVEKRFQFLPCCSRRSVCFLGCHAYVGRVDGKLGAFGVEDEEAVGFLLGAILHEAGV